MELSGDLEYKGATVIYDLFMWLGVLVAFILTVLILFGGFLCVFSILLDIYDDKRVWGNLSKDETTRRILDKIRKLDANERDKVFEAIREYDDVE